MPAEWLHELGQHLVAMRLRGRHHTHGGAAIAAATTFRATLAATFTFGVATAAAAHRFPTTKSKRTSDSARED